jgi:hypothetical protein
VYGTRAQSTKHWLKNGHLINEVSLRFHQDGLLENPALMMFPANSTFSSGIFQPRLSTNEGHETNH